MAGPKQSRNGAEQPRTARELAVAGESAQGAERFKRAIASTSIILSNCDLERRYTWIYNPTANFDPKDVIGKRDEELAPAHSVAELVDLECAVLETGERTRRKIGFIVDGEHRYYDVTVQPTSNAQGELDGLSITAFDITEHWETEKTASRLSKVFTESAEAIFIKDRLGIILDANPAAERQYGWTRDELIGQSIELLIPPADRERRARLMAACLRGEEVRGVEARRVKKDGQTLPVLITMSTFTNDYGEIEGIVAMSEDITELKALQRQILKVADEQQQRIGQELHDGIQQQLVGMAMLAQAFPRQSDEAQSQANELSKQLLRALDEVRSIAHGLVPVDLDKGLAPALEQLAEESTKANALSCVFECSQPVVFSGTEKTIQLYRIAQEAVTNAIKHASASEIVIALRKSDDEVHLEVRDDGAGFEQTQSASGIGLKIMNYRCELIGAVLHVGPDVTNQGTSITCTLPL